jgi:2-(1,2-epoxy-1,2-dihydrophenyl)acetyl-CoA isomerase
MLGEGATGAEAVDLGLAYRCVDDAETLLPEAIAIARRLAAGPTRSLGLSKRLLNTSFESDLSSSLELEAYFQAMATSSPDLVEGMAAFRDKRDAKFTGE